MPSAELLPAAPWLAPWFMFIRLARREPDLARFAPRAGRLVSLIIPARNESDNIATVLKSVLASSYQPLEIIVVDDRSTDDTADIVRRFAAGDPRVKLIEGAELPAGWYGKPWACVQGFRAARGELICFTDADTRHQPELLGHAVGALEAEQADLVTVAPRQLSLTFWERLVMPQIWLLLGFRFHPRLVNQARRTRDVIANGQFILVTRAAYQRVGTHEVVKHEVAEDLALAQAFFRKGEKLFFAFAETLMETRMYQSLGQMIEGWSKNVYLGGRRSFPDEPVLRALVPVALASVGLFWLVPVVVLVLGLSGVGLTALVPAAALAVGLSVVFWGIASAGMEIPALYGLGYPLGSLVTLYIVIRSTWRGRRRVEWRGRTYGHS